MPDVFGRALLDHYRGERDEELLQCDGSQVLEHPVEHFYFGEASTDWLRETFEGPVLDIGAGAGRSALALQDDREVVAIEVSDHLVELMDERGVADARQVDMFALREHFGRDRFESAFTIGTQLGLAGSMLAVREFLGDLAYVTTPDATVVLDNYDPAAVDPDELLGFRDDPTPGLAYRTFWFEYEGERGEVLLFRLFSPERLREAAVGTGWEVVDVQRDHDPEPYYRVRLEKA